MIEYLLYVHSRLSLSFQCIVVIENVHFRAVRFSLNRRAMSPRMKRMKKRYVCVRVCVCLILVVLVLYTLKLSVTFEYLSSTHSIFTTL